MDLVAKLSNEIQEKNIVDKKDIQDYLYKRTGELFSYDPLTVFCKPEEKKELLKKTYRYKKC